MQESNRKQVVRMKWSIAVLIAIASAMTLAGADAMPQITINNYAFSPVPLTVKVGTTVTWINHDDDTHTIDSAQGKFKSKLLDKDDKFEFHFSEAGEYPFNCRLHPKMTGKVIVQP